MPRLRAKFFDWISPRNGRTYSVGWFMRAPDGRAHHCENITCGRIVRSDEWRLCMNPKVDNPNENTSVRKNSHNNKQMWVCSDCAKDVPRPKLGEDQQGTLL